MEKNPYNPITELRQFLNDSLVLYAPEEFDKEEVIEAKKRWSSKGGIGKHSHALGNLEDIEVELSELQEKYRELEGYFNALKSAASKSQDLYAGIIWEDSEKSEHQLLKEKYNKLEEAFRELLENYIPMKDHFEGGGLPERDRFLIKAGLKEC